MGCYIALTMKRTTKPSPAAGEFPFQIDAEPLVEAVTALGAVPLLARAIRSLDVPGSVGRHLRIKQRERGFDEATYIESFLVLNAVGGDCLEDFDELREDADLAEMLGHEVPSAEAARKFLYQFHDAGKTDGSPAIHCRANSNTLGHPAWSQRFVQCEQQFFRPHRLL